MLRFFPIALTTVALSACALFPTNGGVEEGMVWCNSRYLDALPKHRPPFTGKNWQILRIAHQGYPYAVAGAVLLQEKQPPKYSINGDLILERVTWLDRGRVKGGFRAATFKTRPLDGSLPELIVTFKGTNDARDWFLHNLSPAPEQYEMARDYVKLVAGSGIPHSRIVATGFSLGGGLASHVVQHDDTKNQVAEAWLFNPSPRDGVITDENPKVWFAATKGEILGWVRWDYVGTPPDHRGIDYDLIHSSNIYAHSRFVLAREMLHFADLQQHLKSDRTASTSIPLQVLQSSDPSRCTAKSAAEIERLRQEYESLYPQATTSSR